MADASTTKVFTIGLKKLRAKASIATGLMPTMTDDDWHGNVYRDTMEIATADASYDDYFEEEVDLPVATIATAGDTTISFEILRPSPADLLFWCGGSVDVATGKKWSAPTSYTEKTLALLAESKQGYNMGFPKVQVTGSPVGGGQKSTPMRLRVSGKVLVPSNEQGEDQAPMTFEEPSE